jgi:hypothetical protein
MLAHQARWPLTLREMSEGVGITQNAVMATLKVLMELGKVTKQRIGPMPKSIRYVAVKNTSTKKGGRNGMAKRSKSASVKK